MKVCIGCDMGHPCIGKDGLCPTCSAFNQEEERAIKAESALESAQAENARLREYLWALENNHVNSSVLLCSLCPHGPGESPACEKITHCVEQIPKLKPLFLDAIASGDLMADGGKPEGEKP